MYNECEIAARCVEAITKQLRLSSVRSGLIVVDDGSSDGTAAVLDSLQPTTPNLFVVHHVHNGGYGAGVQTGIKKAFELGFDYVLFMDSDLTNDPKYIPLFVEKMQEGCDVIKASRYMTGGGAVGVPKYRVLISSVGNRLSRFLFGLPLTDCTNGFRAARVSILLRLPLKETGFAIIMEELCYAKHVAKTFAEIPYTLTARPKVGRPSSFAYRPAIFFRYLKYAVKSLLGTTAIDIRPEMEEPNAAQDLSCV